MRRWIYRQSYWSAFFLLGCVILLAWLLNTNRQDVFALRNLFYHQLAEWWPPKAMTGTATLTGCVADPNEKSLAGVTVLLAERDGTTHQATSDAAGCYEISAVPAGAYVPVAGGSGFPAVSVRELGQPLQLAADQTRSLDLTLPLPALPEIAPGTELQFGDPVSVTWELPQPSAARRYEVQFDSGGQPNQPTLFYTPLDTSQVYPTLLAVYPGPVDTWEGVSIPLAAAGYAVIAVGPAYSLDLDADVAELQRLVGFARSGAFPNADGSRMVILGGSYSGLHTFKLLQRDVAFRGAVLLGPPTDLFDLRRRFEEGSFFPPFGLDQAMIALGWPNTEPERYWDYSALYHVRADLPPLLLMHSRSDEVVPFQQSELLAVELERLDVTYEAHFFDGMSHYLLADRPSEDLDRLYAITLDFLERTLAEAPPATAEVPPQTE